MPTYVYECEECGREWDEVHTIADRDECEPCAKCGGRGRKIISTFQNHAFRSRWLEGIDVEPVYVESKKQLDSICKKNDCILVKDDRKKQKAYYDRRDMVEEGKRVCR